MERVREQRKTDLGTGSVGRLLVRLALPAVVAQVINMLYNLVDRMYVGTIPVVGTDALAGLGVCFPLILVVSAFAALIGNGGAPLAAIRLGENKREEAEKILNNGVVMLFLAGAALTVLLLVYSRTLLKAFGSPDSSLPYADAYFRIYAIGTLFVLFSLGLNVFISCQGFSMMSMITVVIGAVLNIALDPLFIFTFQMGVRGAAVATVISQGCSCAFVIAFLCSRRSGIRIRPRMFGLSPRVVGGILALGISPFVMQATESAVQIVFNVQLKAYTGGSKDYTAALTIMMSALQMMSLPLNGLGMGAQPLISFNFGAGKFDRIKKAVKYLFCCTLTVCGLIWILCLLWPALFAAIFSATEEVTAVVTSYMPFFMAGCICFSAQSAFQNTFLALGQARISIFLALLRKVILLIPLTFLLPLFLGVQGIFLAEGVSDALAGLTTALVFALTFRKILKKRADLLAEQKNAQATTADFPPPAEE